MPRRFPSCAWLLVIASLVPMAAPAAEPEGTLDRVNATGVFRIGYRTDARPLSFVDESGKPAGYAIDLCRRIGAAVKSRLGRDDIEIRFVPVTTENRLRAVVDGDIDIECGSTTVTLHRMEQVDFSIMTFVTGGTLLSKATNPIRKIGDSAGKRVAVISGTSTAEGLDARLREEKIDARVVRVANRAEGMRMLDAGDVDAFASDQIVLLGQVMGMDNPADYALARELFSYEPYAMMVRRNDAEFRLVANRALAQVFRSGQYVDLFNRWIGWAGIRPSTLLVNMYQMETLPE